MLFHAASVSIRLCTSSAQAACDPVDAMKFSASSILAAVSFALVLPLSAQVAETASEAVTASVVPDGIVFYNGLPYVLRGGRAFLIDAKLVPQGQILTAEGKLVPMPTAFTAFPSTAEKKGTDQQTNRGVVPVVPPDAAPAVQKGTDQQVLINPPRSSPASKVTGSGGVIRK